MLWSIQHGNQHVSLTARHLLEKWQLILDAMGHDQAFNRGNARQPPAQQHRSDQRQQVRHGMLSQLFNEELQLGSSMGGAPYTMEGTAAMHEADAIALHSFPELGGGGVPMETAPDTGRSLPDGGALASPGRFARSASSRPAQAARYASSPDVLWPHLAPSEPLTRAATVAAVPAPLLGGGRARPRPQAAGKGAKGTAADARQAAKQKKPAGPAKKAAAASRDKGDRVRGIAALEAQLQKLKADAARSGDLDWPGDLEALPEPDAVNIASQDPWLPTTVLPGPQRHAHRTRAQDNLPGGGNRQAPASASLAADLSEDHRFWSTQPGMDVAGLGAMTESDRDPEEDEPSYTNTRTTRQAKTGGRARQNRPHQPRRASRRPGGSAVTGEGTRGATPSSTEDGSRKRGLCDKALWTDAEKARYIAVLQDHGRSLARLCAAFPNKCAFSFIPGLLHLCTCYVHAYNLGTPAALLVALVHSAFLSGIPLWRTILLGFI